MCNNEYAINPTTNSITMQTKSKYERAKFARESASARRLLPETLGKKRISDLKDRLPAKSGHLLHRRSRPSANHSAISKLVARAKRPVPAISAINFGFSAINQTRPKPPIATGAGALPREICPRGRFLPKIAPFESSVAHIYTGIDFPLKLAHYASAT